MAKITKVDTINMKDMDRLGKKEVRHINADNVIELKELTSSGSKSLTEVRMSDGTLIHIEKSVDDVTKLINT